MADMKRALNRLAKWRSFFVGWQIGSRPLGDPESDALRDAVDARLIMRAEVNAVVALLIEKGVFRVEDFERMVEATAKQMNRDLEDRFPGVRATDEGIEITNPEGLATIKRMNFKP